MSARAVSIVIPSLGDVDLLERALPALERELDARGGIDEVVVVDDTGDDVLRPWLAERFGRVRCIARETNGGFARALTDGVRAARGPLVFAMNPDVVPRLGFLGPLARCLDDETVFAAAPRMLLRGDERRDEAWTGVRFVDGVLEVVQPALDPATAAPDEPTPIAFAVGGACMLRRDELLERGFDPLFEPFYLEDVDLCWSAWRAGRTVLYQPASVVEHHHRGTIGRVVDLSVALAALERNRLLFQWKQLDGARLDEHVASLYRRAIDAWLGDDRDELVWLCLALERLDEALAARAAAPAPRRDCETILRELEL